MSLAFAGSPSRRALLFRELGRLTGAGIPMERAAEVLGRAWHGAGAVKAMASLKEGIARGETIATALEPSLNLVERNVIRAAEAGGRLPDGFRHLERYYEMLAAARARVIKGLAYPLLVLHAAMVLPAVVGAVMASQSPVVAALRALVILYAVLAVVAAAIFFVSTMAGRNATVDRLVYRIPFLGPARRALALARWSAVLHFHVVSGVKISTGIRAGGEAAGGAVYEGASAAAAEAVEAGMEFGPALRNTRAFPDDFSSALTTAELTGNLDDETARQAQERMAEAAIRLDTASEWIPRLVYCCVAAVAVVMIFRLASLYFGMVENFGKELGF